MFIRAEQREDYEAIRRVNEEAFERPEEAKLVELLRDNNQIALSLVAAEEDGIVGHILFCPVVLHDGPTTYEALGLGPMAVLPSRQNCGIGSALVRQGLDELRAANHRAVVVLGHPEFYHRFGFVKASERGITCEYDAPDEAFMVVALAPSGLGDVRGMVVYPPQFNEAL